VLDLAAGTGANLRYLTPRLAGDQEWLLVDSDEALLTKAKVVQAFRLAHVETRLMDLSEIDHPDVKTLFKRRGLVTASALLDLVSETWLRGLARHCHGQAAPLLFALTYDGRIHCSPEEPEDASIRVLVNRHQRLNKGFGDALGPEASDRAEQILVTQGYHVERETSDWVLSHESAELQRALIDGWTHAAVEIAPEEASPIRRWNLRRLKHVNEGRSTIVVGHVDLAAWVD
jgi:hypothetical protein